jgi:outer membrane protein assembly factor BamB
VKVQTLAVRWTFPPSGHVGGFRASPIVVRDWFFIPIGGSGAGKYVFTDTVFIGSDDGYLYALDAATGQLKWQYPTPMSAPLKWNQGILSSASYWWDGAEGAVIFSAVDPCPDPFPCTARLYAVNARTGALIWKSDPVAVVNGTSCDPAELHQSIRNSSPLILDNKAYVGIANFGDTPIQVGRVVAVDLTTGHIDPMFKFRSVGTPASPPGTRGGGVWNSPATDGTAVYFTTGNTRSDHCSVQTQEPAPNHGLSMLRVDRSTGAIIWAWQPVPYRADSDPDWAAGATVMSTSCGTLIASVQKDGWSYAVDAGNGVPGAPHMRWQFPGTGFGSAFLWASHGDDDYTRPGAAWNDVFVVTTGGEAREWSFLKGRCLGNVEVCGRDGSSGSSGLRLSPGVVTDGYGKLQALNACATTERTRVRWIADIPDSSASGLSLGSPTVTGGIVFIGTDQSQNPLDHAGHLVVLADPSIAPATGNLLCSNASVPPPLCTSFGYSLVPVPTVLKNIPMPDSGNIAGLRDEPALAYGRVFVATDGGHVYMLAP